MDTRRGNVLKNFVLFLLFYLLCTGGVYIISLITHFDYIGVIDVMECWWIISAVSVVMLLIVAFIEKKQQAKRSEK